MKIFYSKRNHVALIEGRVIKTFKHESDYRRELDIYQTLTKSGFSSIASILEVNDDMSQLVIEYLDGPTVLEKLEAFEEMNDISSAVDLLIATLSWLDGFHKVFADKHQGMGDVNLRNFIWYKECVYGIDFEKSGAGSLMSEKAEVLARYLLYDPIESEFKVHVIGQVTELLDEEALLIKLMEETVEAIRIRRAGYSTGT